MKKYLLLMTVCALMLSGCGKIAKSSKKESSQNTSSSEAQTDSMTTSDEDYEPVVHDMQARVSVKNINGDDMTAKVDNAQEFFEFAESVYETSQKCDFLNDEQILTVHFNNGSDEYIYSCCDDGVFARVRKGDRKMNEPMFFKPDSENSQKLRDMMLAYSVLGVVFKDAEYSIDPEHTEISSIAETAAALPSDFDETRYYYVDDRTTIFCNILTESGGLFYLQTTDEKTDVLIGGDPYYQETEFYEYFTDENGKAFYRPEGYDVFYTADGFWGDYQPVPLVKTTEQEEYLYSFTITSDGSELTAEVWQGEDTTDYYLTENGEIKAMWSYDGLTGAALMYSYRTDEVTSGFIDEIIAHAEEHMYQPEEEKEVLPTNAKEWREYDTEKYGLFDLSGGVEIGQEVEPTGVVEEWRRYLSSEKEPFTLEFRWAGAERNEYEIVTFDNGNYYCRHDMELHDKTGSTGGEEWVIDGRLFQSTYYTDEYDSRDIFEWPMSEYYKVPIDLLFEDEQRGEEYAGKCERAYEVTIGNEQYICEEWSLMLGRLWKVYIKDGRIVAWEGDFYNQSTVNTVLRLEKSADYQLLQIPENEGMHISND